MNNKLSERRNASRRLAGVTMPIGRKRIRWGRNWPCMCGSKKKYKDCCLDGTRSLTTSDGNAEVKPLPESIKAIVDAHKKRQEKVDRKRDG